jgi:FMN reductase
MRVSIMANPTVVGFSGNFTRPSKTCGFVEHVVKEIARRHGLSASTYDVVDVGSSLGTAKWARELDAQAADVLRQVVEADVLVVGTPTYKGSYTGLFKHFFDLVDPAALKGKPIVLLATGGGERHALIVEHQLRPLFGFFEAFTLPTAVYASDKDFSDGVLVSEAIRKRVGLALDDVDNALARQASVRLAAR